MARGEPLGKAAFGEEARPKFIEPPARTKEEARGGGQLSSLVEPLLLDPSRVLLRSAEVPSGIVFCNSQIDFFGCGIVFVWLPAIGVVVTDGDLLFPFRESQNCGMYKGLHCHCFFSSLFG